MDSFRWTWSPFDPLRTPSAPSAPFKPLPIPKRPLQMDYTPLQVDFSSERQGGTCENVSGEVRLTSMI